MIIHSYVFAIFFPSLADSGKAFLAPPCRESIRRLSASASWESHPRALARTLSCKYHHSSRLSSPPSGAVPDGQIYILRLADLSAAEVLYRINWYEDGKPSCLSMSKSRHYTRGRLNFFKILCIVFNSVPSSIADNFSSKRHCSSVRYRVPSLKFFAMKTPPPAP